MERIATMGRRDPSGTRRQQPLTMQGALCLLTDGQTRLFYELDKAIVV